LVRCLQSNWDWNTIANCELFHVLNTARPA